MNLLRDLRPLFVVQLGLLIATMLLVPGNFSDLRVQLVWTVFLSFGWLIAPCWIGNYTSFLQRYLATMISAIAAYAVLVAAGSLLGIGMRTALLIWIAATVIAAWHRRNRLSDQPSHPIRLPWQHAIALLTLALFVVAVFQAPRSNDIYQFMMQQQDMLADRSLEVSSIGMQAMGVDQPMPRWQAHYWHVMPCMIAYASGIAVDQVLLRYASLPIAFSVLVSLMEMVRGFAGRRTPYSAVLLAMLGPVVLWYRNYSAFNYSFRITNNLLLDKDFALFFLIPSVLWLGKGWIAGKQRFAVPLIGLVPAILRFHPLTAIYLLLLSVPFAAIAVDRQRSSMLRYVTLVVIAGMLCLAVVLIGDAQSNHEQIRQIIQMDYRQSLADRPIHYWVGFYNTIPDSSLPSDTTHWIDGRLSLKSTLITGCGLLLAMQLGWVVLLASVWLGNPRVAVLRVLAAGFLAITMLWGLWAVSGSFLTRVPHYTAGYERLHWFAYPIALVVVATVISAGFPKRIRRLTGCVVLCFLATSSLFCLLGATTPLVDVKGLNSLLDAEKPSLAKRQARWRATAPTRRLGDLRPDYLGPDDRVVLLDLESTKHYWLIRQGVFWSDPYVEAFAWSHRGDDFLTDRRFFYDLLDRQAVSGVKGWIEKNGITLIVDRRDGAEEYLAEMARQNDLSLLRLSEGVWRVGAEGMR